MTIPATRGPLAVQPFSDENDLVAAIRGLQSHGMVVLVRTTKTWTDLALTPETVDAVDNTSPVVNLAGYTQVKQVTRVTTVGSAGSVQTVQYSLDGTTFAPLTTNTVSLASLGIKESAFETIPTAALGLVVLRLRAIGGNGVADPAIQQSAIMVK